MRNNEFFFDNDFHTCRYFYSGFICSNAFSWIGPAGSDPDQYCHCSTSFCKRKAFAIAMAGGLIQDIIIGNFFGLHLLPYLLITALLVRFGRGRYTRHWYISLLAVVMATIVYLLFSSLILWWGGSHYLSYSYFLSLGIPLTFLNGLSSIILYNLL